MDSPCIGRCDPNSPICPGCGRSDKEICNWMFYDDSERCAIMQRLREQGFGRKAEESTDGSNSNNGNNSGGVFGRKGKQWKLPPINRV